MLRDCDYSYHTHLVLEYRFAIEILRLTPLEYSLPQCFTFRLDKANTETNYGSPPLCRVNPTVSILISSSLKPEAYPSTVLMQYQTVTLYWSF